MRFYADDDFTRDDINLRNRVWQLVQKVSDEIDLGRNSRGHVVKLTAHIVARALANIIDGVEVRDGRFYGSHDHTWLVITESRHVIDVFPLEASGGPQIYRCKDSKSVGNRLFKPCELNKPEFHELWFVRAVERVELAIRGIY